MYRGGWSTAYRLSGVPLSNKIIRMLYRIYSVCALFLDVDLAIATGAESCECSYAVASAKVKGSQSGRRHITHVFTALLLTGAPHGMYRKMFITF